MAKIYPARTHYLAVTLFDTARFARPTPSGFMLYEVTILPKSELETSRETFMEYNGTRIREAGGLGVPTVRYTILDSGTGILVRNSVVEIEEPVTNTPPVPGWQQIVKVLANGQMDPAQIFDFLES